MTKYREILRLKSLGFSERNIAHSCGVSRNTVAKVVKKAAEIKLVRGKVILQPQGKEFFT